MLVRTTTAVEARDDRRFLSALMSSSRCFNCVRTGICDVLYLHSMSSHTAESAPSRRQRRLCAGCGPLTRWFRRCPSSSQRSLIHHVSSWTTIRHDNTQHVTNTRRRHRRRSCRHSHPSEFIFIALDSRHARQREQHLLTAGLLQCARVESSQHVDTGRSQRSVALRQHQLT